MEQTALQGYCGRCRSAFPADVTLADVMGTGRIRRLPMVCPHGHAARPSALSRALLRGKSHRGGTILDWRPPFPGGPTQHLFVWLGSEFRDVAVPAWCPACETSVTSITTITPEHLEIERLRVRCRCGSDRLLPSRVVVIDGACVEYEAKRVPLVPWVLRQARADPSVVEQLGALRDALQDTAQGRLSPQDFQQWLVDHPLFDGLEARVPGRRWRRARWFISAVNLVAALTTLAQCVQQGHTDAEIDQLLRRLPKAKINWCARHFDGVDQAPKADDPCWCGCSHTFAACHGLRITRVGEAD